jgi:hypothetical protein
VDFASSGKTSATRAAVRIGGVIAGQERGIIVTEPPSSGAAKPVDSKMPRNRVMFMIS